MLGVQDPVLALAIDDALHQRLLAHDAAQQLARVNARGGGIAPGLEYESVAEVLAEDAAGRVH